MNAYIPILLLMVFRWGNRWITAVLATVGVLSLGLAHWGAVYGSGAGAFYLLPTRAWELMTGSVVAVVLLAPSRPRLPAPVNEALALCGLGMILYAVVAFDERTPFPGLPALFPTVGAAMVSV